MMLHYILPEYMENLPSAVLRQEGGRGYEN